MTHIIKKILLPALFLFNITAYCQSGTNVENVTSGLSLFLLNHSNEKAYLHFDKPYYAAGDTIYFKAYVTMGERHLLSVVSGVLHVELINSSNKIDQSIKLKLDSGLAWGDFALPDTLPKGIYRVRAYTQWMRNAGESAFFEQTIAIGQLQDNKTSQSAAATLKPSTAGPDLQFFPEGGSLVSGIQSKVAFKAIAANGAGVNVKGEILDSENKTVTTFASTHLGMGCFYFTPEDNKDYKAKITYANGVTELRDLPKAQETGIILSINNDSIPKASVRITANTSYFKENKNREYNLLIWSGGIATTIPCTLDSQVIKLDILKRHLKTGVATVTLFSPNGEPLCERLLFVQNYDQLNINLIPDKTTYTKREKVNLKLNVKTRADSAASGHFSVSVIDETKVPVDENSENTILTNLLLTSDLKGYIEQPNYYFKNLTDGKTQSDLDLVMLTHGYRRFEWKKLLNNEYPPIAWQSENGLEITGTTKTLLGKPIPNGTVSLISQVGGPVLTEKTDMKGNFRFGNLVFMDTTRFVLNATNAKGKNNTQISYNKEDAPPVTVNKIGAVQQDVNQIMLTYLKNAEKQQEELNKYGLGKGRMLKEVKIKSKKKPEYETQSYVPEESANQVIRGDQIRYGGPLAVRLMGLAHGIHFISAGGNSFIPVLNQPAEGPMRVIVDGVRSDLEWVSTDAIASIEILLPPISNIYSPNGAIVITTKPRMLGINDISSTGVLPITVNGFYKAREFYTPKYQHPTERLSRHDLRSTIYWQPELITDKDGNASFNFYNADGVGTYRVVVEGIDEKGNLGRLVYRYKVE